MKVLVLFGVIFLGGCGTFVSMDELEQQAMLTGDWSAVENRERIIAKREARKGPKCASGTVAFCESYVGSQRCSCVSSGSLREMLMWQ